MKSIITNILLLVLLQLLTHSIPSDAYIRNAVKRCAVRLNANLIDTIESLGTHKILLDAISKTNLKDELNSMKPLTLFAPSDAAFKKIPTDKLNALIADLPALKNILLFHAHPDKMSPTRNGKSLNTLLIGEDASPKQLTVKVTNWDCESFIWSALDDPTYVSQIGIKHDNGLLHVIDDVLVPYKGTRNPQITFIGARDAKKEATLQQDYYGGEAGKGRNPTGWREGEGVVFDKIDVGTSWATTAYWDTHPDYEKPPAKTYGLSGQKNVEKKK